MIVTLYHDCSVIHGLPRVVRVETRNSRYYEPRFKNTGENESVKTTILGRLLGTVVGIDGL